MHFSMKTSWLFSVVMTDEISKLLKRGETADIFLEEMDASLFLSRPRNINWHDWKYTSFVVFVGYSQNIRRHNAMCRDELVADVVESIGLKC